MQVVETTFSDNKGLIELLKGGKDGSLEKLKSMSLNIKKRQAASELYNYSVENGQAGKVAKFVQGYQIPDKYKIKPGYREQYREWLEKKKKSRNSKARSAKNANWMQKHFPFEKVIYGGVDYTPDGLGKGGAAEVAAMLFEPPKKGTDRMVDFKPRVGQMHFFHFLG